MPNYFTLVQFEEGGKRLLHVAHSTDVRCFNPSHPDEFDSEKRYDVMWQEGEGSFDGFFSGKIICQAVTLNELKMKAQNLNIKKMPPNFYSLQKEASRTSSSSKPEVAKAPGRSGRLSKKPQKLTVENLQSKQATSASQKKNKASDTSVAVARKKRMVETLQQMKNDCPFPSTFSENFDKGTSRKTVDSSDMHCSKDKTSRENSNKSGPAQLTPVKSEPKKVSPVKSDVGKVSPVKSVTTSVPFSALSFADITPAKKIKSPVLSVSDDELDVDDPEAIDKIIGSIQSGKTSSDDENSSQDDHLEFGSEEIHSNFDMVVESSVEDDNDDKTDSIISTLKMELTKQKTSLAELKSKYDSEIEKNVNLMKQLRTIRASCRLSGDECSKLRAEVNELKKSQGSLNGLTNENKKLKVLISTTVKLLSSGLSKLTETEIPSKKLFESPSKSEVAILPTTPSSDFHTEDLDNAQEQSIPGTSQDCSSPDATLWRTPSKDSKPSTEGSSSKAIPKSLHDKSKKQKCPEGLSPKEILEISEKVRKDIKGEASMPTDSSGQVVLGPGVKISKKKWDEGIKIQSKNSLFVKRLGHAVYGHAGLKVRTVGNQRQRKNSGQFKQVATPSKVDTIVACLRGKLLADDPNFPNIDSAAAAARVILAAKMQDEARSTRDIKKEDTSKD